MEHVRRCEDSFRELVPTFHFVEDGPLAAAAAVCTSCTSRPCSDPAPPLSVDVLGLQYTLLCQAFYICPRVLDHQAQLTIALNH